MQFNSSPSSRSQLPVNPCVSEVQSFDFDNNAPDCRINVILPQLHCITADYERVCLVIDWPIGILQPELALLPTPLVNIGEPGSAPLHIAGDHACFLNSEPDIIQFYREITSFANRFTELMNEGGNLQGNVAVASDGEEKLSSEPAVRINSCDSLQRRLHDPMPVGEVRHRRYLEVI